MLKMCFRSFAGQESVQCSDGYEVLPREGEAVGPGGSTAGLGLRRHRPGTARPAGLPLLLPQQVIAQQTPLLSQRPTAPSLQVTSRRPPLLTRTSHCGTQLSSLLFQQFMALPRVCLCVLPSSEAESEHQCAFLRI